METNMRKVLPALFASASMLAAAWSSPVRAQDNPFKDVPTDHWAYQAVTDLQQKGILLGYPDGYFRGNRTLTRYEFAVALERLLKNLPDTAGPAGPQGPAGPTGDSGPAGPGFTPDEIAELQKLTSEFDPDMQELGTNVKALQRRLNNLTRRVDRLARKVNALPTITGNLWTGFRGNMARGAYRDLSGTLEPRDPSLFNNVTFVHDFHLGIAAKLKDGVHVYVEPVISNYLSYTAGEGAGGSGIALGNDIAGTSASSLKEIGTLYKAYIGVNVLGGKFEMGRVGVGKITSLTWDRPDIDAYFKVPEYENGEYVFDGANYTHKFGSVKTLIMAGSFQSTSTTSSSTFLNAPLVGAATGPRPAAADPLLGLANQGQMVATQQFGVHLASPIGHNASVGLTGIDFGGSPTAAGIGNVYELGANAALRHLGPFALTGEFVHVVAQHGFNVSGGFASDDSNAFKVNAAAKFGSFRTNLGYLYIDPRFYSAGYWGNIANWYNPTNVKGPYINTHFTAFHSLKMHLGFAYYTGARNRVMPGGYGFDIGSSVTTTLDGIEYDLNKRVALKLDYSAAIYNLKGDVSVSGARAEPFSQNITFGAGLKLNPQTTLGIAYQLRSVNDVHDGFGSTGYNANILTTQLAVHF